VSSPTSIDDRYDEPDQLRDQLRQLLRYRSTIALGIALGLVGGLVLILFRASSYSSTSEVVVRPRQDPFNTFGVSIESQVSMGTEREIAQSAVVAARAAKALHQPSRVDAVSANLRVTNPPNTMVLRFEYTAGTAKRAAWGANAFATAYLADRRERTRSTAMRLTSGLAKEIAAINNLIKAKPDKSATTTAGMREQIAVLQKRVSDIRSYDVTGGDIVRRAEPMMRPSGPGPVWLIGLGLLGGLLGGVVLAWLRSALEPRARSVGEVQQALGAPVLGILPGRYTDGELLKVGRVGGSRAEVYRTLAFRLRQGEDRRAGGTLLIVAPKRDAGAEAAAVNLAAAFAESGEDVLVVDATACTPALSARLPLVTEGIGSDPTLADVCEGGVVIDAGAAGRFRLLSGGHGTTEDNLSTSSTVRRALPSADTGTSTLVITRPLLDHADGLAVSQHVDDVLVVGDLDDIRRDELRRVRELIDCAGGHVVGAVLDTGTRRSRLRGAMDVGRARLKKPGPATRAEKVGDLPAPAYHADGTERDETSSRPQQGSPDETLTASRG
jgi:capsular polysaccharide biosynthesis protein/Mrp family chromosome partitioning ATPase